MLTEICGYLHNYFVRDINRDKFTISGGAMQPLDFLQPGQYFRIIGSVFNDGIYQYPGANLTDETFEGEIWAMGVPAKLQELVPKIEQYVADTEKGLKEDGWDVLQSQSFGGFSASAKNQNDLTWQKKFERELEQWRKWKL